MITLGVVVYVMLSLKIAWDRYHELDFSYATRENMNKCYRNAKKSLIQGFVIPPVFVICLLALIYLAFSALYLLALSAWWILTNLP
ncbi:UNVERIFIED_CONTAM: hypothetical protein ABID98_003178 [Brevibacillus sp. OAP136]